MPYVVVPWGASTYVVHRWVGWGGVGRGGWGGVKRGRFNQADPLRGRIRADAEGQSWSFVGRGLAGSGRSFTGIGEKDVCVL